MQMVGKYKFQNVKCPGLCELTCNFNMYDIGV